MKTIAERAELLSQSRRLCAEAIERQAAAAHGCYRARQQMNRALAFKALAEMRQRNTLTVAWGSMQLAMRLSFGNGSFADIITGLSAAQCQLYRLSGDPALPLPPRAIAQGESTVPPLSWRSFLDSASPDEVRRLRRCLADAAVDTRRAVSSLVAGESPRQVRRQCARAVVSLDLARRACLHALAEARPRAEQFASESS